MRMFDWDIQRYWEDVHEGDEIPSLALPLTLHRLVVQAGANRDFNPIHHNTEVARSQGAPEAYANNVFTMGMWERAVREFIGLRGVIKKIGPFRMSSFTPVGETVVVAGTVSRSWQRGAEHLVEIGMRSSISTGDVVTGSITATLPSRSGAAGRSEAPRGDDSR